MDGKTLTQIVDRVLAERGISRLELCEAIGITSGAYTGWKKGSQPREDKIVAIEKYLGINLHDIEKSDMDDETAAFLQMVREDYSYRALFESAKSLTKEQRLTAAAYIERLKAGDT